MEQGKEVKALRVFCVRYLENRYVYKVTSLRHFFKFYFAVATAGPRRAS
jgi:hypothetical protein